METTFRKVIFACAAIGAFLIGVQNGYAVDSEDPATVHVKYALADTELDQLALGTRFFLEKGDLTTVVPPSLRKMMFTRRLADKASDLTIDAPGGVKVFLIIESGNATADCRKWITDAGWKKGHRVLVSKRTFLDVYSRASTDALHLTIPAMGGCSVVVAAEKLEVEPAGTLAGKPAPPAAQPGVPGAAGTAPAPVQITATPVAQSGPTVIELGGPIDQIRTGRCGHFLVFHIRDSSQLTVVDVLAGKVVKKIAAEGDICYCMDRDKLVLVLNNQQVVQRWDLATLTREKTVMLHDDRPVKRAIMGSTSAGPLMMWTDGGCELFDVGTLTPLIVNGTVQNSIGFGPWVSADGMSVCDWGWSSGPYSLMRLSNLTATSVDSRVVNVDGEDFNESWAMPSADGTQLIRHGATIYDASTDDLVALAPGPLKEATVLPTEDPRFLIAVRGEDGDNKTSSVAIVSAFDRRVLYTLRKAVPVTGGMIGTRSGRICSEPRAHYLPMDNKLVLIPNSDDRVVVYSLDLGAALKSTGADYLYVISKPLTVLTLNQRLDYQIQTLSSAGGVKYKLEEGPVGLTVSAAGRVTWKASASAVGEKVPVVITLSDAAGQEVTHAIELHVIDKPQPAPEARAPRESIAGAGKQSKPPAGTPASPPAAPSAKKAPDDPEVKALGDRLAKKLQGGLDADAKGNTEYYSTFSVHVGSAQRSSPNRAHMVLGVHEDRAFLVGGDFISLFSHINIELKKVDGIWTCATAQSTLDTASTSHGPLDLPFPPKTHDLTRTIRSLLDDVQNEPAEPNPKKPQPRPDVPSQRA